MVIQKEERRQNHEMWRRAKEQEKAERQQLQHMEMIQSGADIKEQYSCLLTLMFGGGNEDDEENDGLFSEMSSEVEEENEKK
jgi:hypothetical protein